jgi:hypothetical protein
MNLFDFLTMLWQTARGLNGSGIDFVAAYAGIGGAIWALLLFKVFISEGLSIASGHQTELPRILIKYLFVAMMFAIWPWFATRLWEATTATAQAFFPDVSDLFATMNIAMNRMSEQSRAEGNLRALVTLVTNPVTALGGTILNGLLIMIGMFAMFLCYMLILINIAGSLAILAMNLVIGPVFFGLAFDKDFRSIAIHWFTAALSYMLLMPLYGLSLHMAATIAGAGIPPDWTGFTSTGQIAAQLLGPFMALGIVFSTNKVISALVGGASGSGLGSSVRGAAAVGMSVIPGGGMLRATGGAASQIIRTAQSGSSGSGSSGTSSPSGGGSPTAKASQSNP